MHLGSSVGVQRKGCCRTLSGKKAGLACTGPSIQDDPVEVPAPCRLLIPPDLLPNLAYSQACWGSRQGPRQGQCCHSVHLPGWTFSNPLFLYAENEES